MEVYTIVLHKTQVFETIHLPRVYFRLDYHPGFNIFTSIIND